MCKEPCTKTQKNCKINNIMCFKISNHWKWLENPYLVKIKSKIVVSFQIDKLWHDDIPNIIKS
jgi:hypothetical protein